LRVFFARASKTQQPAYEPLKEKLAETPNSFFTQALLEGLKGGVPDASAGVTSRNLRLYLELRVSELSQKYYNMDQYPEIAPDDYIELVPASASAHYTARLKVAPDSPFAGLHALRIFSGLEDHATVKEYPVNQTGPDVFEASLPSGLYLVTSDLTNPASPRVWTRWNAERSSVVEFPNASIATLQKVISKRLVFRTTLSVNNRPLKPH
jgi:hypothetical protein